VLACNDQGFVVGLRRLGNIADGGGPFENELFAVALVAWPAQRSRNSRA
jgi:hypothetical protein